jgi:hypothetical protein
MRNTGSAETCTVTVAVLVKQCFLSVPVKVYTVVYEGEAMGSAMPALLSPVAGCQLYMSLPAAFNLVDLPVHIL